MPFDEYFDERSGRFSGFYRSRGFARAIGRNALFARLDFAVDKVVELGATRVLDIGCGSGPLFGPLAVRGVHVTGIEPAPQMVALARQAAARCDGQAEVVTMGWEDLEGWGGGPFDVAVALGVFDYVSNPEDLLTAMAAKAEHVIGSFPRPGLRTNLRQVRYGRRGVSVYGYSRERVEALAQGAGLRATELAPLGQAGYILLASPPGASHQHDEPAQGSAVQP